MGDLTGQIKQLTARVTKLEEREVRVVFLASCLTVPFLVLRPQMREWT